MSFAVDAQMSLAPPAPPAAHPRSPERQLRCALLHHRSTMDALVTWMRQLVFEERLTGIQQTRVTSQLCYDTAIACRNVARFERDLRVLLLAQHAVATASPPSSSAALAATASSSSREFVMSAVTSGYTASMNRRLTEAVALVPRWLTAPVEFCERAYLLADECYKARTYAEQELYGANMIQKRDEWDRQASADTQQDILAACTRLHQAHPAAIAGYTSGGVAAISAAAAAFAVSPAENAADPIYPWYTDAENAYRAQIQQQQQLEARARAEQQEQLRRAEADAAKAHAEQQEEQRRRAEVEAAKARAESDARARAAQQEQFRHAVAKAHADQQEQLRRAKVEASAEDAQRMAADATAAAKAEEERQRVDSEMRDEAAHAAAEAEPAPAVSQERTEDARFRALEAFRSICAHITALDRWVEQGRQLASAEGRTPPQIDHRTHQLKTNLSGAQKTATRRLVEMYNLRWSMADVPLCEQVELLLKEMWTQLNRSSDVDLPTNAIITASNRWNELRDEVRRLLDARERDRNASGKREVLFPQRRFAFLQSIVDATIPGYCRLE
jgi:hypothetical protein